MDAVVLAPPECETLAATLVRALNCQRVDYETRSFPDGETYVRIEGPVAGRPVIVLANLTEPDRRFLPTALLAGTARDLGAKSVGLVAPYLPYMRQDARFAPGEGITSSYFARLVSGTFDWLVTVDPHLHRRTSLDEIYTIPSAVVRAAPAISAWIRLRVHEPLLIGPDEESRQWVAEVADGAGAPYVVAEKLRDGDRDVHVRLPPLDRWKGRMPVLIDDIISTGRTMIETVRHVSELGFPPPLCIGVHAIFAGAAYSDLVATGAREVVSCNTIPHPSNAIDIGPALVAPVQAMVGDAG